MCYNKLGEVVYKSNVLAKRPVIGDHKLKAPYQVSLNQITRREGQARRTSRPLFCEEGSGIPIANMLETRE